MAMFPEHEKESAKMAYRILDRLRFAGDDRERILHIIRHHMDKPDEGMASSDAAVRRWIRRVSQGGEVPHEWLLDEVEFMKADESGGKLTDARLKLLNRFEEKVRRIISENPPLSRKNLAVTGKDVMDELEIPPGPRVGRILKKLTEEVAENPALNNRETLLDLIRTEQEEDDEDN